MKTYFEKVTNNVYAFILWDESWKSFNNCYILLREDEVILIDSGKEEHFEHLESSLENIGIDKADISKFIATHGHRDHIGGIQILQKAEMFIHNNDLELLPTNFRTSFIPDLPDNGLAVGNLECILLGHHTEGSVALYDHKSGVLFCGDHLCFFGEPIINDKTIVEGETVKEKVKTFISDWSNSEELRKKHNFELFINGLKLLQSFDAKYLCTGHGVVIKNEINAFILDILDSAN